MAVVKKYLHDLDLVRNKLLNPILNPLSTSQRITLGASLSALDEGYTTYDITLNTIYFWTGSAWVTPAGGGGSAVWGGITGTVTDQTDLTAYLAANYYPLSSNPAGYLTAAVTSVATSAPITGGTITSTGTIGITKADGSTDGYLSSVDWTTFNNKLGGSGTTNYLPKWNTLGTGFLDSQVYDDGNYVRVGIGGGSMGFPYEKLILEAPQDMKFGAYTSVPNFGLGGASYVLGYTNATTTSGYYPGFEFQMSGSSTNDNNYVRYNFLQRDATGTVVANNTDLFNLYADSRISFKKLIGTGTEMVVADPSGFISRQAIPTGGGGIPFGTATGTDTYVATIGTASSYTDGDAYVIRFTNGNTTGCTLNINSIGAVPLYRNNDGPLIGGDIWDGAEMLCIYNAVIPAFDCIGTSPNAMYAYITNDDSVTITKGQVVYAFGGTGDRLTVKLANNTSDSTSAQTVGVVLSTSIAPNQKGVIITQGLLDGLSILPTATYADGDPLYLGTTAGSITNVKPYAPNHLVYLGNVTTASNGSAGRWYVRVQNGYELDELHNVQARTPALKDTLWYDNTVSPGQWKTASLSTILGGTPVTGGGLNNQIAYFNSNGSTIASLSTTTYPSLTELSHVKGVTSGIQTQLGTKVDKSQVAYTMLANNTNDTANMTAQAFQDPGSQTYTGTITWSTPATAPSGTTNHSYRWTRIGNMVTLNISLVYGTISSGSQTNVTTTLPTDCPAPLEPPGLTAASNYMYPAYCNGGNTLNTSNTQTYRGGLRNNAANNDYEIIMNFTGTTIIYYTVTVTYWTA